MKNKLFNSNLNKKTVTVSGDFYGVIIAGCSSATGNLEPNLGVRGMSLLRTSVPLNELIIFDDSECFLFKSNSIIRGNSVLIRYTKRLTITAITAGYLRSVLTDYIRAIADYCARQKLAVSCPSSQHKNQ